MKIETWCYTSQDGWLNKRDRQNPIQKAGNPFLSDRQEPTFILVFGASQFLEKPDPIRELVSAFPCSVILGCSTSGEICGSEILDNSCVACLVHFDQTSVRSACASVGSPEESFGAGAAIAQQLMHETLQGILVLSDGLLVNGSELVRGVNSVLPESVVVTGGLAGDGDRFRRTWVIKDGLPQSGFVTALGLYGQAVKIGHGSKGGWDIFGPERLVTKSVGNVLYELDGKPALQLYKEYLGDRAAGLPATGLLFPLALRSSASDTKQLVRTILAIDDAAQSMTFAGDIPQGHLAQLMRANFDRLIHGASEAAWLSKDGCQNAKEPLAIAISCVGRRLVLGERAEEEIEATQDVLPDGTHQLGFYSYGELSPYASGSCDLHNQTMTLTTISEE